MSNFKELLPKITLFALDVDGVLTDGKVTLMSDGSQIRRMNTKDGLAINRAIERGYEFIIISGGSSNTIVPRLEKLGIKNIHLKVRDKLEVLKNFLKEKKIKHNQVLFMGDDIPDLEVLKYVEVATCPKNAAVEIQEVADYISDKNGGEGCVRDVIEQVLRCKGDWF